MDLKGSMTEQNVKAALMGESVARNKYTYYADQARKEGNQEIAALFDRMAGNESVHAKIWFTTLNGAIKGNLENLKDAAAGSSVSGPICIRSSPRSPVRRALNSLR